MKNRFSRVIQRLWLAVACLLAISAPAAADDFGADVLERARKAAKTGSDLAQKTAKDAAENRAADAQVDKGWPDEAPYAWNNSEAKGYNDAIDPKIAARIYVDPDEQDPSRRYFLVYKGRPKPNTAMLPFYGSDWSELKDIRILGGDVLVTATDKGAFYIDLRGGLAPAKLKDSDGKEVEGVDYDVIGTLDAASNSFEVGNKGKDELNGVLDALADAMNRGGFEGDVAAARQKAKDTIEKKKSELGPKLNYSFKGAANAKGGKSVVMFINARFRLALYEQPQK